MVDKALTCCGALQIYPLHKHSNLMTVCDMGTVIRRGPFSYDAFKHVLEFMDRE